MNQNKQKTVTEEKEELGGNIVVMAIGCKQCPMNEEYRISKREEVDAAAEVVGKVIECPNCHGKWILKRVQVRGAIEDNDDVTEEWRAAPLYIPILSSFDVRAAAIVDAPIAMLEDEKEDE